MVAFDPGFGAVGVNFFLPDWEAVLDVVDDVAAGEKSIAAVVCSHANPDCDIAGREWSDAMHDGGVDEVKLVFGFIENRGRDFWRELWVAAVVQGGDDFSLVVITHPTFVAAVGAGCEVEHLVAEGSWVDGFFGELELHVRFT